MKELLENIGNFNGWKGNICLYFPKKKVRELKRYGITEDMLKSDGCFPYYVAAYKIKRHLIEDKGTYWQRIANYHSRTAEYNLNYQKKIRPIARKWSIWLKDYLLKQQ